MDEQERALKDPEERSSLGDRERSSRDIEKLKKIILEVKKLKPDARYNAAIAWAENYLHDSEHFYKKKDYYSAFGAANYAYGIIDGILIIEGRKDAEV